ncbi:exopolygalacturonase-like [Canna indica]|uniref:Exopolygalacturonase n=1 Tax=Canna indica TaxID=4628 RepID=A0AAQ3Q3K8_9LILI|nr:exopolygalacturonase-like [Canna indica]
MEQWMKLALICICLICHEIATVEAARAKLDTLMADDSSSDGSSLSSSGSSGDSSSNGSGDSSDKGSGGTLSSASSGGSNKGSNSFNVMDYGAKADGKNDDSKAFQQAWSEACNATGKVKVIIPNGEYFLNPIQFSGPCPNVQALIFQMQGTLKASTDLSKYGDGDGWLEFGWVDHLTITGGGTFDGQGAVSWPYNQCPKQKDCKVLPTSVKFLSTNNTVVEGVTSLNSKFFHMALLNCINFKGSGITIKAPGDSPNTDGIHLESNTGVTLSGSNIGTGDDCISIGQGNTQVSISGITCGPGHGISVGSLGRYKTEKDVGSIIVRDSTFIETINGVRIKTWANSPTSTKASNMTFENLTMKNVGTPILIDQTYCPYVKCDNSTSSRVKLNDIKFKNIHGTASMAEAVVLECSKGVPCQNISLQNINLKHNGSETLKSTCLNAMAEFSGTNSLPPCS